MSKIQLWKKQFRDVEIHEYRKNEKSSYVIVLLKQIFTESNLITLCDSNSGHQSRREDDDHLEGLYVY